jgi:cell division protein FtsN
MRFEIKKGGALLILVALVGLSGAVFALGLVAGYQMAKQNQPDLNQTSTTYPLPAAPTDESKPAPVAEMSPPPAMPIKPAAPPVAAMPPSESHATSHESSATVARVRPPAPAPERNPNPVGGADEEEADSEPAPPPPVAAPPSGRPYNIQIEAVMDKSGADEMVSRLKALGYNAQEMTTNLNGQTWYRVRVGPYRSSSEAAAAQSKLREQYKQAYTTSH